MAGPPQPPNASRAAADQGLLTGVKTGRGFVRLEIDDFCQQFARINLYLLAMESIQDNTRTAPDIHKDWWCWWQIQGIHGVPWAPWRGVGTGALYRVLKDSGVSRLRHSSFPPPPPTDGDRERGYCNHSSVLFPTWHRAYEAMIEQAIQATMGEIAAEFPKVAGPGVDRALIRLGQQSRAAALAFRQPYWDPLRPRAGTAAQGNLQPGLSLVFAVKQVVVTRPSGAIETIANPLYAYKYPDRSLLDPITPAAPPNPRLESPGLQVSAGQFVTIPLADQWAGHDKRLKQTSRYPPTQSGSASNNVEIQRTLERPGGRLPPPASATVPWWRDLMEKAYHTLMRNTASPGAYHQFATIDWFTGEQSATQGTPAPNRGARLNRDPLSLEGWHNSIHGMVGGTFGTMSRPPTAGHDPIFIFHHGNIDRHFALYQAINPGVWFGAQGMAAADDTFTARANTFENPLTPLMPFLQPTDPKAKTKPKHPYWTSDALRHHQVLGYEYDPISSALPEAVRQNNAKDEVNRTLNWWSTGASNDATLNPVPMDKVRLFVQQPPLLDDLTTPTSLWTVTVPTPGPSPAPPAGPGPTPLVAVTPLSHRVAVARSASPTPDGPDSSVVAFDIPETSTPSPPSSESTPLRPPEPPPAATDYTTLPDSDYKYIFPPHTISATGRVPVWFFNFRSERHCLGTNFTVYVFLGDFGEDHTRWLDDEPNLLAPLFQFVNHNPDAFEEATVTDDEANGGDRGSLKDPVEKKTKTILRLKMPKDREPSASCGNCAEQELRGAYMADTAPLTQNLIRYIRHGRPVPWRDPEQSLPPGELEPVVLRSLEEEDVVPFLQRNLHWRVVRSDGMLIDRKDISSFKAFVTRRYMTLPKRQSDWPVYEHAELMWAITNERPSGLAEGEQP